MTKTIDKTTPHMFMWITNGKKKDQEGVDMFAEDQLLLPNVDGLEYLDRLKNECQKLQKTNSPAYLIYMGRTLKNGQKQAMEDLANLEGLENLMVLDYDQLEGRMGNVEGERVEINVGDSGPYVERLQTNVPKERMVEAVAAVVEQINSRGSRGGLMNIVDSTRLILLYNSGLIKDLMSKNYADNPCKTEFLKTCSQGLIYRDFDVSLIAEEMPDLETASGYISSLDSEVVFAKAYQEMLDANEEASDAINNFFTQEIDNPKNFSQNLRLYDNLAKGIVLEQDEIAKIDGIEGFLGYFFERDGEELFFEKIFSKKLAIENSFLGVAEDKSFVAANAICEVFGPLKPIESATGKILRCDSYAAVKRHFRITDHWNSFGNTGPEMEDIIYNSKLHQTFHVGNDNTWQLASSQSIVKPSTDLGGKKEVSKAVKMGNDLGIA